MWFAVVVTFVVLMLVMPLIAVFAQAFAKGVAPFIDAVTQPDALAAIGLTLITALIAVPFNAVFGVVAAVLIWAIAFLPRGAAR